MHLILSHPTANANVRALLYGLEQKKLLAQFHTCVAVFPGTFSDRISHLPFLIELKRRSFSPAIQSVTFAHPYLEMARVFFQKLGIRSLIDHEKGVFSIDAVMRSLDIEVSKEIRKARNLINSFYGYEDASLNSFEVASELGIRKFYDLPTGHWRSLHRIFAEEADRLPNWISTMPGMRDSNAKLERKDTELSLADVVFVASSFTKNTLSEFPGMLKRVEVVPYGFPQTAERVYKTSSKLKLLFVGKLSQQKGIADLFAAIRSYENHVELTLIGHRMTNQCKALDDELNKHEWIPTLPHHEILKKMQSADLLVFPSFFDGFGLVITEAMSQGTPVLASTHSAGPDIINNGVNGWLMQPGDVKRIREVIDLLLQDRSIVEQVGRAAMQKAASRPWAHYSTEIIRHIAEISHFHYQGR